MPNTGKVPTGSSRWERGEVVVLGNHEVFSTADVRGTVASGDTDGRAKDPCGNPELYAAPRCWDFTLGPSESCAGFLHEG